MLILKSVAHPNTTVIAEPLGEDGSVRLTPIHGERLSVSLLTVQSPDGETRSVRLTAPKRRQRL